MAKATQNPNQDYTPPTGKISMPDEASFGGVMEVDVSSAPIGRAEGIDYEKWAVAVIDMTSDPARIAATRMRFLSKGYKKVEGDPVVNGFTRAEVWVLPRAIHSLRLQERARKIQKAVDDGRMTEFALPRAITSRSR